MKIKNSKGEWVDMGPGVAKGSGKSDFHKRTRIIDQVVSNTIRSAGRFTSKKSRLDYLKVIFSRDKLSKNMGSERICRSCSNIFNSNFNHFYCSHCRSKTARRFQSSE